MTFFNGIIAGLAMLVLSVGLATAQEDTLDLQEGTLDLTELSKMLQKNQQEVVRLQGVIDTGIKNATEANQRFDEMIQLYQNLIDTVGSQSEIAEKFDIFIKLFEDRAEKAAGSPKAAVRAEAEGLLKVADDARKLKIAYVQEAGRAVTIIDGLKDEKEVAVIKFQIRQGNLVNDAYRKRLEVFSQTNNSMETALKDAQSGGVIIITTPVEN